MKDKECNLEGIISTCVDDFDLAGKTSFVNMIKEKVKKGKIWQYLFIEEYGSKAFIFSVWLFLAKIQK